VGPLLRPSFSFCSVGGDSVSTLSSAGISYLSALLPSFPRFLSERQAQSSIAGPPAFGGGHAARSVPDDSDDYDDSDSLVSYETMRHTPRQRSRPWDGGSPASSAPPSPAPPSPSTRSPTGSAAPSSPPPGYRGVLVRCVRYDGEEEEWIDGPVAAASAAVDDAIDDAIDDADDVGARLPEDSPLDENPQGGVGSGELGERIGRRRRRLRNRKMKKLLSSYYRWYKRRGGGVAGDGDGNGDGNGDGDGDGEEEGRGDAANRGSGRRRWRWNGIRRKRSFSCSDLRREGRRREGRWIAAAEAGASDSGDVFDGIRRKRSYSDPEPAERSDGEGGELQQLSPPPPGDGGDGNELQRDGGEGSKKGDDWNGEDTDEDGNADGDYDGDSNADGGGDSDGGMNGEEGLSDKPTQADPPPARHTAEQHSFGSSTALPRRDDSPSVHSAGPDVPFTGEFPSWTPIPGTIFSTRIGPGYAQARTKAPSGPALYETVAVRSFRSEARTRGDAVMRGLPLPPLDILDGSGKAAPVGLAGRNLHAAAHGLPEVLVAHFQFPYEGPSVFRPSTDGRGAEVRARACAGRRRLMFSRTRRRARAFAHGARALDSVPQRPPGPHLPPSHPPALRRAEKKFDRRHEPGRAPPPAMVPRVHRRHRHEVPV